MLVGVASAYYVVDFFIMLMKGLLTSSYFFFFEILEENEILAARYELVQEAHVLCMFDAVNKTS